MTPSFVFKDMNDLDAFICDMSSTAKRQKYSKQSDVIRMFTFDDKPQNIINLES